MEWLERSSQRKRRAEEVRERKGQRGRQSQTMCGLLQSPWQKGGGERVHTDEDWKGRYILTSLGTFLVLMSGPGE